LWLLEPQKRERKASSYAIDDYYRTVMRNDTKKNQTMKLPKQPIINDFQFFPSRLHELLEKERNVHMEKNKEDPMKERIIEILSPEEITEKEKLLEQGFSSWSRRDFNAFVKGCEKYGRDNMEKIAGEIESKSLNEVRQYSTIFWEKYKDLNDWERIIKNIEKGEGKIKRKEDIVKALDAKVSRYQNPFKQLKIMYGTSKGKIYTEEEDQFLVCNVHKIGYGNWEELKMEIRRSWQFRFDWFLKSRTTSELNRRCDTLIRLIEKENQEIEEKEQQFERKRKAEKQKAGKNSITNDKEQNIPTSIRKRRKLQQTG